MKNDFAGLLCLLLSVSICIAQPITQGPIVGGVTNKSAKIFIRTDGPQVVALHYSTDQNFASFSSMNALTSSTNKFAYTFNVNQLSAATTYYYRFLISSNYYFQGRNFTTFPPNGQAGHYTILSGSCINYPQSVPIFDLMANESADLFLETGDWGYPDTTDNMPTNNNFFSKKYQVVVNSYEAKYASPQLMNLLFDTPMDYVYDDHDFANDNCTGTSSSYYSGLIIDEILLPSTCRPNSIKGYNKLFPHYKLADMDHGVYHSFKLGNAEFFVLDCRSNRSPNTEGLSYTIFGGEFNPPVGHTILGSDQLNWLINGLSNSTSEWKFIISSVVFNQGYQEVLDYVLNVPLLGVTAAAALVDSWVGFPEDQQALLDAIAVNDVKNVFVISGDSHTSAIDDGTNSGLPEMMAANLLQTNSQLANIYETFGFNIWNRGGQGLGNSNYNNAYGKIEIFYDDSVCLSLIDEFGTLIAKYCRPNENQIPRLGNTAFDWNAVVIDEQLLLQHYADENLRIRMFNAAGQLVLEKNLEEIAWHSQYDVSFLPSGIYFVQLVTYKGIEGKKLIKK